MSFLRAVDLATEYCKEEEAKINASIRRCREILRSLRSPQRISAEEDALAAGVKDGPAVPPEELEEVWLLEGALARALRIRSALGAPECTAAAGSEGRDWNRTTSTNHVIGSLAPKSTSKPSVNYKEAQKLPVSRHRGGRTGGCAAAGGRAAARPGPAAQTRVRTAHCLRKTKHPPTASALGCQRRAEPVSRPPEERGTAVTSGQRRGGGCVTETEQTGAGGVTAGDADSRAADDGNPSQFLSAWRTQSAKQDRLWDKILTRVSHPLTERTEFIERLRGTFPACWPHGGPTDTQAEVGQLILQCRALTHCYQTELQTARPGGPPDGSGEESCESQLMLQGLAEMVGDLLHRVEQLKSDADVWERLCSRDPAGCPIKSRWPWEAPPTPLSYSSQTELVALEGLRLSVALLQQDVHLQLVLSEALGSCSSPPLPRERRPSPSVLRGLYSLLAEGGLRFPALVLDTEPD
ncbi:tubulin epsilon and delta complex protein 2 isoform X2 [Brienomyrus brachyistius]|uniref:tubulin epsilon and delta complex protein 2 isoform X2 n=1 Tax=Brienomyrus brachyistius TaxID=42636 RepID=UPI0020B26469|nr:tubulin epsilon and delta complex protein 2 isoform X2 [Brienomyrus brachyistius]